MRLAVTGTRPPVSGFTPYEQERIVDAVMPLLQSGDQLGCGGCIGVDELVGLAVVRHNAGRPRDDRIRLVVFLPSNKGQIARAMVRHADLLIDHNQGYLERDQALVNWAEHVVGIPLYDETRQPRSGTWATVRMAKRANKLAKTLVLRPNGAGVTQS